MPSLEPFTVTCSIRSPTTVLQRRSLAAAPDHTPRTKAKTPSPVQKVPRIRHSVAHEPSGAARPCLLRDAWIA